MAAFDGLLHQALVLTALLCLPVGNALVTTLPAFLISTAMGMMVTRVASDGSLGSDLASQLFARPEMMRAAGALVFDPISIIGSHVAEVARMRAEALFGRQELQTLLEHLRATVPTVVKEVGTELLPLPCVHRAFALLLRERAWPRDPVAVLESMIECAGTSRDPRELAEAARRCTVPALLRRKEIPQLEPLLLDPQLERELTAASGAADPRVAMRIHEEAETYAKSVAPQRAAIVCTSAVRPLVADFLARSRLRINVFSYAEIPPEIRLVPAAVVRTA